MVYTRITSKFSEQNADRRFSSLPHQQWGFSMNYDFARIQSFDDCGTTSQGCNEISRTAWLGLDGDIVKVRILVGPHSTQVKTPMKLEFQDVISGERTTGRAWRVGHSSIMVRLNGRHERFSLYTRRLWTDQRYSPWRLLPKSESRNPV